MEVVKRIIRYLNMSQDLELLYSRSGNFKLMGFADPDNAGYLVDRKSTSRMAYL